MIDGSEGLLKIMKVSPWRNKCLEHCGVERSWESVCSEKWRGEESKTDSAMM